MFGPSGFFQTIDEGNLPISSKNLEVIYDSEAGFSILYRGSKNGRFFAYKALKPAYRGNPLYEELLKKDFNIGFSLTHSNICQYYGMIELPDAGNCIVMEWVDGCSLEQLIAEGNIDGRLARKIICELCDALDYMHRKQIIHRDLKPENILVTHNGRNVKVIDFGLSDADSYNTFKTPAGTRVYASLELLAGESIDSRSDLYSLGMIINELSKGYGHVVRKCICRNRKKRFETAAEVKQAALNEGKRKFMTGLGWMAAAAVATYGLWWGISAAEPVLRRVLTPEPVPEHVAESVSEQLEEPLVDPAAETPSEPAAEPVVKPAAEPLAEPDTLDEASLEALFNQASELL